MISMLGPQAKAIRAKVEAAQYEAGLAAGASVKQAGDAKSIYGLSGRLYLSQSNWLLLDVPNALVRGLFSALDLPGIELPPGSPDFRAHISVLTGSEVEAIGADNITERGKRYKYQLGPMKFCEPTGWKEMSAVYFVEVASPELKELRKTYGLSPLPHGDHEFHISVAVRRKGVIGKNNVSKAASTASEVRKVVEAVPSVDLYGAWYNDDLGKARVSLGDWSETPYEGIESALTKILGKGNVEVDYEIGSPEPARDWLKLAASWRL